NAPDTKFVGDPKYVLDIIDTTPSGGAAPASGLAFAALVASTPQVIATCLANTDCTANVTSSSAATRTFKAVIANPDGSEVQASSLPLAVTWNATVPGRP